MTIAQTKAARRRMIKRYGGGSQHMSVAQAIEAERRRAAREALRKSKSKK